MVKHYTTQEVADKFQISKKTLYRWEAQGKIPKARRSKNRYRSYTEEDIRFIEKLSKEGRMNWNKNIVNWIATNKITPELWKLLKSEFPGKYRKIQENIKACGIGKIKVGFADNLRPAEIVISL